MITRHGNPLEYPLTTCSGLVLLPLLRGASTLVVTHGARLQAVVTAPPGGVALLRLPVVGIILREKMIVARETTIDATAIAPEAPMTGIVR